MKSYPAATLSLVFALTQSVSADNVSVYHLLHPFDFVDERGTLLSTQRRRRIEERRAMMRQSRSTSSRQEVFELSKQRTRLYG